MGPGGLYVFVLLGLLMVASEENKGEVTRCWAKGREVTLGPHECPAEFAGADAKFCCRLCYGANCCLPRRPRVNLDRCPPESRMAKAFQDYTAAPDLTTTPPPRKELDWRYILLICLILVGIVVLIPCCWFCCRRFWKTCWPIFEEDVVEETQAVVEETQARVNVQSSRVLPLHPSRVLPLHPVMSDIVQDHRHPYSVLEEDPPPYSSVVSQGIHDLPPPYPGPPVVAFQRSHSHGQDDTVVILPRLMAPPQEAASASAPVAVLPRGAVTGSASEETGLPEAAASSSA